jgi:GT2 family glycosyltransferase
MDFFYSIIIPNYNGVKLLEPCLASLYRQTFTKFEVIVVDDASSDNSVSWLREHYPQVRLVVRQKNGGFTAACNDGIDAAEGDIIILFNNDAEAQADWLAVIARALQDHPAADVLACKILLYDKRDTIHTVGDFYGLNAIPGNRGVWQKDNGQYDQVEEVFSACGAAAVYRKKALDVLRQDNPDGKVFDETLFMYLEDVDLGLRMLLRGMRCVYLPQAVVYHRLSATGGGVTASYYAGRNFIRLAVKDLPATVWRKNWFAIIRAQLKISYEAARAWRGKEARARLRGQFAGLRSIPQTLKQRKRVQAAKAITDAVFIQRLEQYNQNL